MGSIKEFGIYGPDLANRFLDKPFQTKPSDGKSVPKTDKLKENNQQDKEYKVRPKGVEPLTYGSEDHCSIQLSYGRKNLG